MPDWNKIYSEKDINAATPAEVLLQNTHLLPEKGRALDYASGLAGNGFYLAHKGFNVSAWDLSEIAVEKTNAKASHEDIKLQAEVKDLENTTALEKNHEQFDLIVVSYFLHRQSLRKLYDYLKKGGLLFYQTYSGQQRNGTGPARAAFRLHRGELLSVYSDMQLLYYREDTYHKNNAPPTSKPDQVYFVAMK